MTPQRLLLSLARVLTLLGLVLGVPRAALSQTAAPGALELAPEARARVAHAAEDSGLAPWQRELMLGFARTGTTSALDASAAEPRDARPATAAGAGDGTWDQLVVPGLYGHSAIYDPVRDRVVVFGGMDPSIYPGISLAVWVLSLAGTPAWTQLTPSGSSPNVLIGHSAIYDPVRDQMVVYGGSGLDNGVWTLSLVGTPVWARLSPSGAAPLWRSGHSAIYDPVRDRMVVFGGITGAAQSSHNDVWAL